MHYLENELRTLIQQDPEIFKFVESVALDGLWYWDLTQPEHEWMNERFWQILGYAPEDKRHLASEWQDIINPDDLVVATDNFYKHCENPKHPYDQIVRYTHKQGHTVWIRCYGKAIRDEQGQPIRMLGVHQDVTSFKSVESKLQRQQQMLEQMSELGRIGAWEVDLVNQKLYWSSMTKQIHEVAADYQPNIDTAVTFYKAGHARATIEKLVNKSIKTGQPYSAELPLITAKGREIWIATRGRTEMFEGECVRIFGSIQDISDKKSAEKALIEAKEAAESGDKSKSEFLATMSHEIRTPLNGVLGMLHLLEQSGLNTQQTKHLKLARNSASTLLNTINDILDFSKLDANKVTLEGQKINLVEYLEEFAQTVAIRANDKGIELILDVSAVEHPVIITDPYRLRQILDNLVSNAIKFTHRGSISLYCETKQVHQSVLLSIDVADTGIGIDKEQQKNLFKHFSQVDSSTTRKYGGTGLGLVIARKLCQLMGGDISLTSEPGAGTTFSFCINTQLLANEQPTTSDDPIGEKRIGTIGISPTQKEVITNYVVKWGGNEALVADILLDLQQHELAHQQVITQQIVLIDHALYHNNSAFINQLIQTTKENVHWLLIEPVAMQAPKAKYHKIGFKNCISKPICPSELFNKLNIQCEDNPAESDEQTTKITASNEEQPATTNKNKQHVLLVEDNFINTEVAKGILQHLGMSVITAVNGQECIEILAQEQAHNISLIFMDCQMPIVDGYQATQMIRNGEASEQFKQIPIIAMTANSLKGDKEKCLAAGMDDYLSKPISPDKVAEKLRIWLPNKTQ
ncbi:PAS domain-containing hybrid sensor histidine kinase/response regulator [Catenovulum agarivorans]|uniref:PAS domain-containing hybrid sensor histidine kinase/response regulator n=1 Tax=Catenovulum agarivorans TaxID=1172192 RepID=UPI00030DDADF|nr:PAS domain-containing hybrid sensor histidine kinase/response regulator [Catenovulum agarivorans]